MATADIEATSEALETLARGLSYNSTTQESRIKWMLFQAADVIRRLRQNLNSSILPLKYDDDVELFASAISGGAHKPSSYEPCRDVGRFPHELTLTLRSKNGMRLNLRYQAVGRLFGD